MKKGLIVLVLLFFTLPALSQIASPSNLNYTITRNPSGNTGEQFIVLTWQDNSDNETGFQLEYTKNPANPTVFSTLRMVNYSTIAAFYYHDPFWHGSGVYKFRVRAYIGNKYPPVFSNYSNVLNINANLTGHGQYTIIP